MDAFWAGFEKRANVFRVGQSFAKKTMPLGKASFKNTDWAMPKPPLWERTKNVAGKARDAVMATPRRALSAGLAAGTAAGAGATYAATRKSDGPGY